MQWKCPAFKESLWNKAIKPTIANQLESLVHSYTSLYALKEKIRMRVGTYGEIDFADDVGESTDFELNFIAKSQTNKTRG